MPGHLDPGNGGPFEKSVMATFLHRYIRPALDLRS